MPVQNRYFLLHLMDKTRNQTEVLLSRIDPTKQLYTGWTIKEVLAHLTGWDDAVIDSLLAYIDNKPSTNPIIKSLDEYNAVSISSRWDYTEEQILKEWRSTRQKLRNIIEQFPKNMLESPVIVPWGEESTPANLMIMLCEHEEEHFRDISEWLKNPANQF
jgi:hypothetical protein